MKWMALTWMVMMLALAPAWAESAGAPPPIPEPAALAMDTVAEDVESESADEAEPVAEVADEEPPVELETETKEENMVIIKTSLGDIQVQLNAEKAPLTVANFLAYVDDGHYDGTIFHRVIANFMIQGGGFDANMRQKPTRPPIKNEAANGLQNKRGTIAMARTAVVDSATSQFFINVVDNAFLDFRAPTPQGFGYCVFGEVVEGMDVVDQIRAVRTGVKAGMSDVPVETVEILSVTRVE